MQRVVMNSFCLRQFEKGDVGFSPEEFTAEVNSRLSNAKLQDGYAPFCKALFIDNFTSCPAQFMAITDENRAKLVTDYAARQEYELPVLRRFFRSSEFPSRPPARYLHLILYSREQIEHEEASRSHPVSPSCEDYEWAIVAFKLQDEDHELPMQPITIMRNALGKAEGGSGIPLDRSSYLASVDFWLRHAIVI